MIADLCGQEVVILVDSGSSSNFVSEAIASKWRNWSPLKAPVQVRVANGEILQCTHELPDCPVWISGHAFKISLKILPLSCYDVILGIDWLASHSPMEVDWKQKWLSFSYMGERVLLQGINPHIVNCDPVNKPELSALVHQDKLWCMIELQVVQGQEDNQEKPKEVQLLIEEFSELFEPPTELPPKRATDHSIPLLLGSQPFRLRPYRYNASQKDEIESQIKKLLRNGWIQESDSPYASPALLVKKKTGDWCLCVDYRRLNAMTVKNKFPLPVIDELLDELVGASWFTTLDLSSGFHQILMAEQDIAKTAFQTHHGHYEYRVMPYGVTGGPATFQHVMNSVLAIVLRKFVVVFIDDVLIYSKTWAEHLQHIREVFTLLQQHQFKVKLSK